MTDANGTVMHALSVRQPFASMIADGRKTIEIRSRPIRLRGDLLIVSTQKPVVDDLPCGMALCVVLIVDCRPMQPSDAKAAFCDYYGANMAWVLGNVRPIKPFPVHGKLGIYPVEFPTPLQFLRHPA